MLIDETVLVEAVGRDGIVDITGRPAGGVVIPNYINGRVYLPRVVY